MPFCPNCGSERGDAAFCSNCGASAPPPPPPAGMPSAPAPVVASGTNGLAIASFVCSLLCISLVGVILGHIAMSQMKKNPQDGRGLAIAGLVLGYIGLAVTVIWFVFVVGLFAVAGSSY
jgi:uncharacterized membrane protein